MENFILSFLEGVGNIDFNIIWKILLGAFLVFWIVVLDWIWVDSGERTSNRRSRILYVVLAIILNIFGWLIYLIIRPNQTIEEIYWADLERRYLKYETLGMGDCPKCGTQLFPGYLYCPNCNYKLKRKCPECGVYIEKNSNFCPFCSVTIRPSSVKKEEPQPSIEEMQRQNLEIKEELTQVVETRGTKYSRARESISTKLGEKIIGGYKLIASGVMKLFSKKEEHTEIVKQKNKAKAKKKKSQKRKRKR